MKKDRKGDKGSKSKFDYGCFEDGYDFFAVNKGRYTLQEALDIYKQEMSPEPGEHIAVTGDAFVRHRWGNIDGETHVGWWIEYEEHPRSCPVWAMHPIKKGFPPIDKQYQVFKMP